MGARLYPERSPSASNPPGSTALEHRARVVALVVLIGVFAWCRPTLGAEPAVEARWKVTSAHDAASTDLALVVNVEKGWHLNANDPDRPYLIPTTLDVVARDGVTIQSVRYPDAMVHGLAFAPGTSLRLYEGTFTIAVRVAGPVPAGFDATLGYQACNDETCLPPKNLAVPFDAKKVGASK